jgi:hypothetical protein
VERGLQGQPPAASAKQRVKEVDLVLQAGGGLSLDCAIASPEPVEEESQRKAGVMIGRVPAVDVGIATDEVRLSKFRIDQAQGYGCAIR